MSERYLVMLGAETALRIRLPELGRLAVGRGAGCAIRAEEKGVAELAFELIVGPKVLLRAVADGGALIPAESEEEHATAPGSELELAEGDRFVIGPLEAEIATATPFEAPHPSIWDEAALRDAVLRSPGTLVRLRARAEVRSAVLARLRSADVVAELPDGELGLYLPEAGSSDAQVLLGGLDVEAVGVAERGEDYPRTLRAARPSSPRRALPWVPFADPLSTPLLPQLEVLARASEPLLVSGESGVGKDRVVERMVALRGGPLVRIAAVELDAEGLPHELLTRARGGTLLLDELSALSERAQLALNRDMEAGGLEGVRLIGTSNQDLENASREGRFRTDLYYRIARLRLEIPPLRVRPGDVQALSSALLERAGRPAEASMAARDALARYEWPGNVRELEGVIERALLLGEGELQIGHLPPEVVQMAGHRPADPEATLDPSGSPVNLRDELAALERRRILEALEKHPNQTEAAKALGIPLRTFLNRMDALDIPRARKR